MANSKSLATSGVVAFFGFALGIILGSYFGATFWVPPWVIHFGRFCDLELLGIPLLMDAGSGVMGCAPL